MSCRRWFVDELTGERDRGTKLQLTPGMRFDLFAHGGARDLSQQAFFRVPLEGAVGLPASAYHSDHGFGQQAVRLRTPAKTSRNVEGGPASGGTSQGHHSKSADWLAAEAAPATMSQTGCGRMSG